MRNRKYLRFIAVVSLLCLANLPGVNQVYGQSKQATRQYSKSHKNRPTVSPYTSLLNAGTTSDPSGGLSYYNIVQPQQRAQKTARGFGDELKNVESRVQNLQNSATAQAQTSNADAISTGRMSPTGHRTTFGDLSGYYPSAPKTK